ncbi:hypothetical protein SEVIR_4G014800v4 [Setaria viridis]|uniref:Late embryogenesis abundant protein LEA-2 subgroup domain-containing protein n=1 Tax=Setaria viridis TaxID=4556 RepID=A0A4U6V6A3_SETVI|nr:uncharacterized protein LOC117852416 [Setaria viridis]TKW19347.1 hypothetical protein SEVIR_4G014800v2 [Setaria viridis]
MSSPRAPPGGIEEAKHYMSPPAPGGGIEAKHYILAALAVTLIAAAVVTVVFVVLSPARIVFSITEARHEQLPGNKVQLNLTIAAKNPSRRATVWYRSMYVDVSNNTGPLWTHWLRANVTTPVPLDQPTRNETKINATVALVAGAPEDFTGNGTSHGFRVMITTVARFKVGVSWTRLYDIKVACGPLDFFANQSSKAGCKDA